MRERVPFPDDRPDDEVDDRDELPEPNPRAGIAERPSDDAIEEPAPEQVETEITNAGTTEDF
jgi:hypothetical protein